MARNGPEFEKMTMEKQKDNPKFSFLFGGEFYSYYKCKLALEQQQRESPSGRRPPPGLMRSPAAANFFRVVCCFLCRAERLFLLSFPEPGTKIDCWVCVS